MILCRANFFVGRQAVIDALETEKASLNQIIARLDADDAQLECYVAQYNQVVYDIDTIKKLPVIQGEPLTDREQRIFLAAMSREKDVCKQVDDKYGDCEESDKNSLIITCHEIIRKVKSALWR